MSTDLIQNFKQSYPDDGLRDYVRTKAVKAAAKKHVYYSALFRDNNITDYSQYRPIDIARKIKELWDIKGEDYVPNDEEYNKIIYLNDKQKLTLAKNYEKEKEKLQLRERVKEEKKEKKNNENSEKKPRGRPKKDNVTVIIQDEDNNEQNKIEDKSTSSSSVEIENIMEEQPHHEIKTKTTIKEDVKEKKRIEREEKKKIKEVEKEAAKELKKAEREKKKVEKEAEKQANKKKPGRPKKTTNIYVSDSDDNKEKSGAVEEVEEIAENEEYLEEEVTVRMMEVDGKTFYYDSNDVLYDINTHEELGKIEELFPGYKKE